MQLADFKQRIADNTTVFKSVKVVVDLASAQADQEQDTAYVLYTDSRASDNDHLTTVRQQLITGVAVIIAINNHRDQRGEKGIYRIEVAREEVMSALIGWESPGDDGMVMYRRGNILNYSNNTIWWQDEFEVTELLTAH